MKRKLLTVLLVLCCVFCLAFGLTSCDKNDGNGNQSGNTEQNGQTGSNGQAGNDDQTGNNDQPEQTPEPDDEKKPAPEKKITDGIIYTLNEDKETFSVTGYDKS